MHSRFYTYLTAEGSQSKVYNRAYTMLFYPALYLVGICTNIWNLDANTNSSCISSVAESLTADAQHDDGAWPAAPSSSHPEQGHSEPSDISNTYRTRLRETDRTASSELIIYTLACLHFEGVSPLISCTEAYVRVVEAKFIILYNVFVSGTVLGVYLHQHLKPRC